MSDPRHELPFFWSNVRGQLLSPCAFCDELGGQQPTVHVLRAESGDTHAFHLRCAVRALDAHLAKRERDP